MAAPGGTEPLGFSQLDPLDEGLLI
jgi:hypothetical protein